MGASAGRVLVAVSAVALRLAGGGAALASDYDYDLTRLEIGGASSFVDDFSDGERDLPPTSALKDALGVTTEIVGALRLTDADGADPFSFPNGSAGLRDLATLDPAAASAGIIDGAGSVSVTTTWSGALPSLAPGDYSRAFGEQMIIVPGPFSPGPESLSLLVTASAFLATLPFVECQHSDPQVVMAYTQPFLAIYACDPIDPQDWTGSIQLRTDFDDAQNSFSFAYSLDGGTTFEPASQWARPLSSLAVPSMQGTLALPGVAASAASFPAAPLPGPGIATALALLAATLMSGALRDAKP